MSFLHVQPGFKPGQMLFRLGLVLLTLWLVPGLGAARLAAETRLALVIGNAAYQTAPALDNPSNDASDVAAALNALGFRVMLGIDQNQDQMDVLIAEFGTAAETADIALFFFAGHAFQVSEQNYLVPVDVNLSQPDKVAAQTVSLGKVLEALSKAPGLKLLFLDACRDNPLDLDKDDAGGLARVGSAADFLIAYATQPGAVAYDGEGRNGTFTEALLSHIRTPAQDVSEMMISVRKDVVARTGGQQIPWESSSLTRQFRFNEGPPTASPETIFYQVATRSADPDLLRLYLSRYPDGSHVSEVLALLAGGGETGIRRSLGDGAQLWDLAQRTRLRTLFETYLAQYPEGPNAAEARRMVAELPAEDEAGAARRCEILATHPRDRTETTPGAPYELLAQNGAEAIRFCAAAMAEFPEQPKYEALLARAYAASGLRARAVELYQSAAQRGDLRAMVSLALLKETGDGLAQDPAGALVLYEEAAAKGSADAAINLAVSLLEREGDAQARARGLDLLQQASRGGSAIATFNLGVMAQDGGFGDPTDALPLFERAAREGEARGYRAAAVLLDEGRGVPRDPSRAAVQLLLGIASDDGALLRELSVEAANWQGDTLVSLQERLGRIGLYQGPAEGKPGAALDAALALWRNGGFNPEALSG